MNYIYEINTFYDWLIENSVSANAQALWHRLMAYCNSFGWKDEFTISNTRLVDELEMTRQSFDRARNILIQKGRITYQKGTGNKCGTYHMISFCVRDDDENITSKRTQGGHKADTTRTLGDTQAVPLNKHKQNLNINKKDTKVSKEKTAAQDVFQNHSFSDKMKSAMNEWFEYKQQRKEKYTPIGINKLLSMVENKLKEFEEDDMIEAINVCMSRNYQGIIFDLLKQNTKEKSTIDLEDFIETPKSNGNSFAALLQEEPAKGNHNDES